MSYLDDIFNKKTPVIASAPITPAELTREVASELASMARAHNKKKSSCGKARTSVLASVYSRALTASATNPMARVLAHLELLETGTPSDASYTADNDLLPKTHPLATNK
jgi:hypothetical protein